VLVEPYVAGLEKLFEPIAVAERVETTGPADKNVLA